MSSFRPHPRTGQLLGGEVHAVDHQRDGLRARRSAVQRGQVRFSHRHEAAGHCRLAYRRGRFSDPLPYWFEADR